MGLFKPETYEKMKSSFQIFSDRTSMHGFNELFYAKFWFWRLVWFIVVFGAIIITFYQVYQSILQYIDNSSVTLITPLDVGGMLYPSVSVCYIHWITWISWKKAYSLNFTKDTVTYGLSFISEIYSPTVFNVTDAKIQFLQTMALNNISTLTEFYRAIAKPFPMVVGENGGFIVENPTIFTKIEFHLKNSDIYLCYKMEENEIMKILSDKRMHRAASRNTGNYFNFSIQDPAYYMYGPDISYDEYNYYVARWLLLKTNYWLDTELNGTDYRKNYTSFTFPIRLYPDTNDDNYVEITSTNDAYMIQLQPTVNRWLNTERNSCTTGMKSLSTEDSCNDLCKAKFRKELRICLALDYAALLNEDVPQKMCQKTIRFLPIIFGTVSLSHSDSSDTSHAYETTTITSKTTTVAPLNQESPIYREGERKYNDCISACVATCEIWKYEFAVFFTSLTSVIQNLSFKNQTDVYIQYPEESDVLIVVETDAQTWEDFIANVGGLLGVWTGASMISFLQVFYLCCFTECTCSCRKQRFVQQSIREVKVIPKQPETMHLSACSTADSRKLFKVIDCPV